MDGYGGPSKTKTTSTWFDSSGIPYNGKVNGPIRKSLYKLRVISGICLKNGRRWGGMRWGGVRWAILNPMTESFFFFTPSFSSVQIDVDWCPCQSFFFCSTMGERNLTFPPSSISALFRSLRDPVLTLYTLQSLYTPLRWLMTMIL